MTYTERVYNYLAQHPDAIVSEIAADLGIYNDAVEQAVNRLMRVGIVEVSGLRRNERRGKPPRQYRLGSSKVVPGYWPVVKRKHRAKQQAKKYRDQKLKLAPQYGPFSTIIQQVIR